MLIMVDGSAITGINILGLDKAIEVSDTVEIKATTVTEFGKQSKLEQFTVSSDRPDDVIIEGKMVTFNAPGTYVLTVTDANNTSLSGSINVVVMDAAFKRIELQLDKATYHVGEEIGYSYKLFDSKGIELDGEGAVITVRGDDEGVIEVVTGPAIAVKTGIGRLSLVVEYLGSIVTASARVAVVPEDMTEPEGYTVRNYTPQGTELTAGYAYVHDDKITMVTSGNDSWSLEDAMSFLSKPVDASKKITITAKVHEVTSPASYVAAGAKAIHASGGVMFRYEDTAGSYNVFVRYRLNGDVVMNYRTPAYPGTNYVKGSVPSQPVEIKLEKDSNIFTGSYLNAAGEWKVIGSIECEMGSGTILAGVGQQSGVKGDYNSATFSDIVITEEETESTTTTVKIVSITAPDSVTNVPNGTAKTAEALGLPSSVQLITDNGNQAGSVTWDVDSSTYNPDETEAQTFTVNGIVTLPEDLLNPDNISLNVQVSVSVKAKSMGESTEAVLKESGSIEVGSIYEVIYELNNAVDVAAQDITITYDPSVFEPVLNNVGELDIQVLSANTIIQEYETSTPGAIHVILTTTGGAIVLNGDVSVFRLSFTAKSVADESIIAVTAASLTNGDGEVIQAGLSSITVTVTIEEVTAPTVDKSDLEAKIVDAQALTQFAYTESTWAALQTALTNALAAKNDTNATQIQVDTVTANLEAAISALVLKPTGPTPPAPPTNTPVIVYDETAGTVKVTVNSNGVTNMVVVDIPRYSFNEIAQGNKVDMRVETVLAAVTFDDKAFDNIISSSAAGDIQISIATVDKSALSQDARNKIGDRPVIDFTVKSGSTLVSRFGGGKVEISIPYTIKAGREEKCSSYILH